MYQIISFTKSLAKETIILVMIGLSFICPAQTPEDLVASSKNDEVLLEWSSGGGAITGYTITRTRLDNNTVTTFFTGDVEEYTDTNVTNGVTYKYVVDPMVIPIGSFPSEEVFATPVYGFEKKVQFDGSASGILTISDDRISEDLFDCSSGTIEFWLRIAEPVTNAVNGKVIFSKHDNVGAGSNGFHIVHDFGQLFVVVKGNSTQGSYITSGKDLNEGDWHHVAFTYAFGGTSKLYIDGDLVGNLVNTPTPNLVKSFFQIGGSSYTFWQPINAEFDELRIWNREMTQSEIQNNMHFRVLGNESFLNAVWHFDESGINDVYCEGPLDCSRIDGAINGVEVTKADHAIVHEKFQASTRSDGTVEIEMKAQLTPDIYQIQVVREDLESGSKSYFSGVDVPYIDDPLDNRAYKYYIDPKSNFFASTPNSDMDSVIADQGFGLHYYFDGDEDEVIIPSEVFQDSTGTVEFLIKMNPEDVPASGTNGILGKHDLGGSRNGFIINHDGASVWVHFKDNDGNTTNLYPSPSKNLGDGKWHHIALTYNIGVWAALYVDGEFLVGNSVQDFEFTDSDFFVGQSPNAFWQDFSGSIDELVIWDDILSNDEIKSRQFTRVQGNADSLRACFHFDEAVAGSEAYDDGLYNLHGTVNNAAIGNITEDIKMRWLGEHSEWDDPFNWNLGRIPGATDNVIILDTDSDPVLTNGDVASVDDLMINENAKLTVESGATLAIHGTATNKGTYTVEKYTEGNIGYSVIGSPVSGIEYSDLGAQHVYAYEEITAQFYPPSGTLAPGLGCFVAYNYDLERSSPLLRLSGTPNYGEIDVFITGMNEDMDYYNLVANPYAAPIKFSDFLSGAPTINGSIWLWDDGGANLNGKRVGDYIIVNSLGVANNTGNTGSVWNGYIGSFQGFFVYSNTTSGKITFKPDMQSTDQGVNGHDNHFRKESSEHQLLKLSLSGNGLYNEIILAFLEEATYDEDDGLDARKLVGNPDISFYSIQNDVEYAIQGLPLPSYKRPITVPLGFHLSAEGKYNLDVSQLENIPADMHLRLLDKTTGISYDLKTQKSIPFKLEESGDFENRFEIKYQQAISLNVDNLESEILVYGNSKFLNLQYPSESVEKVTIYSLNGEKVFEENIEFNQQATIHPVLKSDKIYILNINSTSVKFIINN